MRHVSSVFKAAVRDRLIWSSPMEGLRPPKKPNTEVVPLTVEQVQLIAESIQPRYSALVLFIAMSGLRPGEAFGVTKDRVGWLGRSETQRPSYGLTRIAATCTCCERQRGNHQ